MDDSVRDGKHVSLVLLFLFLDARKIVGLVIFASVVQRAIGAVRPDRLADKLAEFYEDLVEWEPILPVR